MKEGRLIVERRDASDIGMRDLYVIVDELPEETLLYGGSLELPLPPGEHRVKVTNRLFSRSRRSCSARPDRSLFRRERGSLLAPRSFDDHHRHGSLQGCPQAYVVPLPFR